LFHAIRLRIAAGLLVPLLWSGHAFAQARVAGADLRGTVRDATGAVLTACTITVTNRDTNVSRTAVSDDSGRYVVAALPPGAYIVTATTSGFRSQSRDDAVLTIGQTLEIDFALTVASSTAVVVSATAPLVSTGHIEVGSVITQQQIQSLPTNGRNFIGFAALVPGVAPDRTPLTGVAATSGLSFTGQRGRSNNITVDGLDNNDPVLNAVRATFSQEAVREFQVLANSYSAEFGKASGGLVNIVTKSGTNAAHGSAFLFFRDKRLNAKNYFDRFDTFGTPVSLDKPPFRQEQWGGTFGGPVRKDKTFFFASYEGTNITDSRLVSIDRTAATPLTAQGFPIDLGNVPFAVRNSEWLGKLDQQWTASRALSIRGNYADIDREGLDDFGGIVAKSRSTVQLRQDWSLSASETEVLSARWIHELRGQFAHQHQQVNPLDPNCGADCVNADQGGPTVEVAGVASVGRHRFTPFHRLNRRVQVVDTFSYFRGAHRVKFGGDYSHLFFPSEGNLLASHFGGRFIFSPIPALGVTSALDGLQKGIPAAYLQAYGDPHYPDERYGDLSLFAQDEWQRGRLTLRPGLRYQVQFWQDAAFTLSDVGGTSFRFPMPQDRNDLAPRLGVSYDLTGTGRTIAHGAYGMFYDNMIMIVENGGRLTTSGNARAFVVSAPLASIAWAAPGHHLTEPQVTALVGGTPPSVVAVPSPSLKASFTHQASVGVDKQLASDLTIAVNVVYVRGHNLPGTLDYNPLLPSTLGAGRRPNDVPCAINPVAPCINGGIPGSSTSLIEFAPFGESWYKGLTIELGKRLSHRYQFTASYTLSKAEDTSTDFQTAFLPQNNGYGRNPADKGGLPLGFDPLSERGPATFDQRHRLVLSGVYEMPRGFQLSGIVTAGSGRPFSPLAGADLNGDGNGGQFPPDRARRNPADESTSVGRDSGTTLGYASVDVRVSRRFALSRGIAVEGMLEAFNLFNRVNFTEDTNQSSFVVFGTGAFPSNPLPAYGRYTQAGPPRQVQLAARLTF
jgi:hypothetical protein